MIRRAGVLPIVVGAVLAIVLIGAVVTVLVLHGHHDRVREAGPLREVGRFSAGTILAREIVGDVQIVWTNVSGIVVMANIPVEVNDSGGVLTVYCPVREERGVFGFERRNVCNDYRGGRVVIETGSTLSEVQVRETVGNADVTVNATRVILSGVVGKVFAKTPAEYVIDNVVGDVSLHARRNVSISHVVGNVNVLVPGNLSVQLSVRDVVGNVRNAHSANGTAVLVSVSNIVGNVTVG
jgi:hypothetical protein